MVRNRAAALSRYAATIPIAGEFTGNLRDSGERLRLLSPLLRAIDRLTEAGLGRQLALLHFHVGSQIPSINAIKNVLREATRMYAELALENGSGLSRQERISAEHMGRLLLEAWRSAVMPELMSSQSSLIS